VAAGAFGVRPSAAVSRPAAGLSRRDLRWIIGAGIGSFALSASFLAFFIWASLRSTPPPSTVEVVATDYRYDSVTINAEAGKELTVNFKNSGAQTHNVRFQDKGIFDGTMATRIVGPGGTDTIKFTPKAGTYSFYCDVYPHQMSGTLNVK
jgi:nitrite reductase (NO-forming)